MLVDVAKDGVDGGLEIGNAVRMVIVILVIIHIYYLVKEISASLPMQLN